MKPGPKKLAAAIVIASLIVALSWIALLASRRPRSVSDVTRTLEPYTLSHEVDVLEKVTPGKPACYSDLHEFHLRLPIQETRDLLQKRLGASGLVLKDHPAGGSYSGVMRNGSQLLYDIQIDPGGGPGVWCSVLIFDNNRYSQFEMTVLRALHLR